MKTNKSLNRKYDWYTKRTTNTTKPGGNQFQTWTAEGAPHNRQKTLNCVHACVYACAGMCVCVGVCVCVCVCVCRSKDVRELSSIICLVKGIFSLILKYLAFQFSYLCKYWFWRRGKISLLSIHPCFSILGLGRLPPFPYQNLGVLEEYIRA